VVVLETVHYLHLRYLLEKDLSDMYAPAALSPTFLVPLVLEGQLAQYQARKSLSLAVAGTEWDPCERRGYYIPHTWALYLLFQRVLSGIC
jgi:hypothetical protein